MVDYTKNLDFVQTMRLIRYHMPYSFWLNDAFDATKNRNKNMCNNFLLLLMNSIIVYYLAAAAAADIYFRPINKPINIHRLNRSLMV